MILTLVRTPSGIRWGDGKEGGREVTTYSIHLQWRVGKTYCLGWWKMLLTTLVCIHCIHYWLVKDPYSSCCRILDMSLTLEALLVFHGSWRTLTITQCERLHDCGLFSEHTSSWSCWKDSLIKLSFFKQYISNFQAALTDCFYKFCSHCTNYL